MLNEAAVTSHNVYGPVGLSGDLAALQIYLPSPPTPTINMYLNPFPVRRLRYITTQRISTLQATLAARTCL